MSQTGATDAQIEAAAQRHPGWINAGDEGKAGLRFAARIWGGCFIPPDHRLLEPDQVAALGRVLAVAKMVNRDDAKWAGFNLTDDDLAILAAVIGE